jgi:Zn finger protein HypA/HybF involved in hydrogenase expression
MAQLTHDEAVARIAVNFGDKITVIGRFNGTAKPIDVRCQCGHQWSPILGNLLNSRNCPVCAKKEMAKKNRFTQTQVEDRIRQIFGVKITVVGKYQGNHLPLAVRCECGRQWAPTALSLFKGSGCQQCSYRQQAEAIRFTQEQVIARIADKHGTTITVLSQYQGSHSKLTVRCACGHQWDALANKLFVGQGCPQCALNKRRVNQDEALTRLKQTSGGNITPLTEYPGDVSVPWFVQCGTCQHQWTPTAKNLFKGQGCPKCAIKAKSISHDDAVARLEEISKGQIIPVGRFQGVNNRWHVQCRECQHDWSTTASGLLQGSGCPKCSRKRMAEKNRITTTEALARLKKAHNDKLVALGVYQAANLPWHLKCQECQYEWHPRPSNIFNGYGCPNCTGKISLKHEQACERLNKASNGKVVAIEQYPGNVGKRWHVQCRECQHKWSPLPQSLFGGTGCPICNCKLTPTQAATKLKEVSGGKIVPLEDYQGQASKNRWLVQCADCQRTWRGRANSLLRGAGCQPCGRKRGIVKRTTTASEAAARLQEISKGQIIPLKDYPGTEKRWHVQCRECQHIWSPKAGQLFQGSACPKCSKHRVISGFIMAPTEAATRLQKVSNGKIIPLEDYYRSDHRWHVQCADCQHAWNPLAFCLFDGQGCPKCAGRYTLTHAEAVARLEKIHGDKIVALEDYTNTTARWHVQCTRCQRKWKSKSSNLFNGRGCQKCSITGFRYDKPGITYYVRVNRVNDTPLYKIGITNRTVAKRFDHDFHKITILKIWNFDVGLEAYEYEQKVLRENAFDIYRGPAILRVSGNDELFVCDVLGLDVNQPQLDLTFAA